MYRLLFKQFLRTSTSQLGLLLILILGIISIAIGKQFLTQKEKTEIQVSEKQAEHIERVVSLNSDDIGLLVYYLEFALINETSPLAGISIGQNDINPSVQSVSITTLEGQKYDTDLVNPTKLLFGNLDLSFVLIYVFPLIVIAFTYNLRSEETETGTWRLVNVMAKSTFQFLLAKMSVRIIPLLVVLVLLFSMASFMMGIPLEAPFLLFFFTSFLYLLFWFALSLAIISLKRDSSFNALTLLSIWLALVILLPAVLNNLIATQYPVPEAFTTMIKQRDGYHEKWDRDKRSTVERFYKQYPQLESYGYPPEKGFNWLWYFAMQNLGDVESSEESAMMRSKILQREQMSRNWAKFIPSMHTQLVFNDLAGTSLTRYMNYLNHLTDFHERVRLEFYPIVFSNMDSKEIDWSIYKPEYSPLNRTANPIRIVTPLFLLILLFFGLGWFNFKTVNTH